MTVHPRRTLRRQVAGGLLDVVEVGNTVAKRRRHADDGDVEAVRRGRRCWSRDTGRWPWPRAGARRGCPRRRTPRPRAAWPGGRRSRARRRRNPPRRRGSPRAARRIPARQRRPSATPAPPWADVRRSGAVAAEGPSDLRQRPEPGDRLAPGRRRRAPARCRGTGLAAGSGRPASRARRRLAAGRGCGPGPCPSAASSVAMTSSSDRRLPKARLTGSGLVTRRTSASAITAANRSHVGEVARLLAVALDRDRLAGRSAASTNAGMTAA